MTTPRINTVKRGGSRFYVHPDHGEKVPGVTSVVSMLPKPFLPRWAAKSTAEWTVDNLGAVISVALNDRQGAVDLMKGAPWRDTKQAADAGTAVHDLYERLGNGENVGRVHPDLKPYVQHFNEFVEEFQPEFVHQEETVWSDTHAYAGSFDLLASIDGDLVWIDYKTTRSGVYPEVALQLAAYAHADVILQPDGSTIPLPKADQGAVLHVRPEGWQVIPVYIGPEVFEVFLHLREVFEFDRDLKDRVLGNPLQEKPSAAAGKKRTKKAAPKK